MKTIEERATEYARLAQNCEKCGEDECLQENFRCDHFRRVYYAFINGAEEQKRIDKEICDTKSNPKYIWIAREEDIEDKYSDAFIPGVLNLFYDKPSYVYNSEKGRKEWGCARKIAEIPNYMYPDVTFKNSPIKFKMEA